MLFFLFFRSKERNRIKEKKDRRKEIRGIGRKREILNERRKSGKGNINKRKERNRERKKKKIGRGKHK